MPQPWLQPRACRPGRAADLQTLDRPECLRLLGSVPVGRVAYTIDALPSVQPVPFALHGDRLVFRTCGESRLATALAGAIVAFEADEYDCARRTGWSVTVVGPAVVCAAFPAVDALATTGGSLDGHLDVPPPWTPCTAEQFAVVSAAIVRGHRFGA